MTNMYFVMHIASIIGSLMAFGCAIYVGYIMWDVRKMQKENRKLGEYLSQENKDDLNDK